MSDRVFVVGAGKVGRGLAAAFRSAGVSVVGVHARAPRTDATSSGSLPVSVSEANVVLFAVSDNKLDAALASLADRIREDRKLIAYGTVVLHTSGTATPAPLAQLRAMGIACGTFHPLAPFASSEAGARALKDGWVGIDGDASACGASRRLAAALGARTVTIAAGKKDTYHAAAVFASNFPVVLASIAAELFIRAGVEPQAAESVVGRLMQASVANLSNQTPANALTGPAARGDMETIERHRAVLASDPELAILYDVLTKAALRIAGRSAGNAASSIDDTNASGRRESER